MLQGLASLRARQSEVAATQQDQQLALAAIQVRPNQTPLCARLRLPVATAHASATSWGSQGLQCCKHASVHKLANILISSLHCHAQSTFSTIALLQDNVECGMQDAVTTCCESMDELQTATEGGHSNPAVQEALGSLAARLGQAEKALQKAAAQQVGNSSRIAAMAAQRAHLQGGLEDCASQLASLREEVRKPAVDRSGMPLTQVGAAQCLIRRASLPSLSSA